MPKFSLYLEAESTVRAGPVTVTANTMEEAIEKAKKQKNLTWLLTGGLRDVRASKVWDFNTDKVLYKSEP